MRRREDGELVGAVLLDLGRAGVLPGLPSLPQDLDLDLRVRGQDGGVPLRHPGWHLGFHPALPPAQAAGPPGP